MLNAVKEQQGQLQRQQKLIEQLQARLAQVERRERKRRTTKGR
jgi:type II secretory pathway component PulM